MVSRRFSLGFENVKNIPIDKYEYDFTFIVDGKEYRTSRILADLFSPIISEYHAVDETINSFTINTSNIHHQDKQTAKNEKDYFSDFLKLTTFEEQEIDPTACSYYSQYFLQLGNFEEYMKLQREYNDEITTENVIDNLKSIDDIFKQAKFKGTIYNNFLNKLVKFASNHFYELDKEKLLKLSKEQIEMIIEQDDLKIEDEDSLLLFILRLYQEDESYSPLFECVYFENVNDESLESFIEQFSIENLTFRTWISISYRLIKSRKREEKVTQNRYTKQTLNNNYNILTFSPDSNNNFHGILRYLSDKAGGNVHDKGIVDISSSNDIQGSNFPKNAVDYNNKNTFYAPRNVENVDICFDFKEKQIQPTNYMIQSIDKVLYSPHLRNWVIEVSNDKINWDIVDEHSNDQSLNDCGKVATFNIKQTNLFYRYFRLRQTGFGWGNNYYSYILFIEIYGKLKSPNANI